MGLFLILCHKLFLFSYKFYIVTNSLRHKIENRPMALTSWSWVQITATFTKLMWLTPHRKSKILGNNSDIMFAFDGEI